MSSQYDVLIVGAGIAGSALAHALSRSSAPQRRIALLERSLAEPDRIVGELLQPAGVAFLNKLGLQGALEGIDAIPVHGYAVVQDGRIVHIPYPDAREGRSFHHGQFVQGLREHAKRAKGVDVIEATVSELVEEGGRVVGVKATRSSGKEKEVFRADLTIIADGCFSNFRSTVQGPSSRPSQTKSHFCGAILKDVRLPMSQHGTVALVRGHGPVLLYQISEHDTRMLVDVKNPLPSDLKKHIITKIVPSLPPQLHEPIRAALSADRLRRMPNSFLPPAPQSHQRGVILLGDAWNMRHPLTGGGMTVALSDVYILSQHLDKVNDLKDWTQMKSILKKWWWERKGLAATINILSVALYDLFGADGECLTVLQDGCFKYFERGGESVRGPVSLLSGISPSTSLLAYHFFYVAFYSMWSLFAHPRPIPAPPTNGESNMNGTHVTGNGTAHATGNGTDEKYSDTRIMQTPSILDYPRLFWLSCRVLWTALVVFGPLLWTEIRWW
ncbi:squalene epoxidase-domain-containing protein [Suillus paluster]|uniref:squalene epoxidase-domain-containing protein n=1 Tax=Suillus paluster TaxID=48578 RepID=UPI001B881B6E|nr:squalene epoxidase-domain-containing protein [Suillus paluster]KAG1731346.1 squalene epoxidase-domain-containing protein [Suillus paluster]